MPSGDRPEISFDENYQIRVLSQQDFQHTENLKSSRINLFFFQVWH
jgi:hypothetical protein